MGRIRLDTPFSFAMTLPFFLKLAAGFTVIYGVIVALVAVNQRSLQYFPYEKRIAPKAIGLADVEELIIETAEGLRVIAWHRRPADDKPVVLYFHGNGGSLAVRADRFADLIGAGFGLLALSYRGYGGSGGYPTEDGLLADGLSAFDLAARDGQPVIAYGESLGSGVAVHVAANRPAAAMVLEAPFTSALDVGKGAYPYLPVSLLMKDRFHSDRKIGRVTCPVTIVHGTADNVVPLRLGKQLFELANEPKRFVGVEGGTHGDLWRRGAFEAVKAAISDTN